VYRSDVPKPGGRGWWWGASLEIETLRPPSPWKNTSCWWWWRKFKLRKKMMVVATNEIWFAYEECTASCLQTRSKTSGNTPFSWTTAGVGGCWWMLAAAAENQTKPREKQYNNLLRRKPKSFGNKISNNNTKSWENDANLRKEKVPELSLSLSHTHTLSLSEFLEKKTEEG
jgi:hypothetical protein